MGKAKMVKGGKPVADAEEDEANYYKVTYEDEEGDWLLVGDVPWE